MSRDTALAMYRLLPTGDAWPDYQEDTEIKNLITGIAQGVNDYVDTVKDTMAQYYPGQPGIFVTDWEQVLGLPKCGQTGQTLQTRLAQILAMFRISPYSNAQFFIDIAEVFGYTITIVDNIPDTVIVTGASSAAVNLTYTLNGTYNARVRYTNGNFDCYYKPSGSPVWAIGDGISGLGGDIEYIADPYVEQMNLPTKIGYAKNPFTNAIDPVAPTLSYGASSDPFRILIQVDAAETVFFSAGVSSAGDPLEEVVVGILECILNFFRQSHTYLEFVVAP